MGRQIDIFSKEIEDISKNQTENFEVIGITIEIKSPLEDLKSRMEMRKKRVNGLKSGSIKFIQSGNSLLSNKQSLKELWDNIRSFYISVIAVLEREEKKMVQKYI